MNLKLLQLIMDIRSHQFRHSLPTFLKECPLPFGVANFAVIYVCQYSFMRMVAKSLRSTFLKKNLKRNVTFQTGPQSTFFTKTKNPLFCFPSLVKRCKTSTSLVTTDNQIKNYFFKELFILYVTNQRSHVESINTLLQGTPVFFKSIYRDSNLTALSLIFKS